jgi:8-oxo-dGTP diphosphatase
MGAPTKYAVAADIVVFCRQSSTYHVLLIQRKNDPYKLMWALPGGFLEPEEDLKDCALRELQEETGLNLNDIMQVGAYGKPGRDPRGRVISIAFVSVLPEPLPLLYPADDAAQAAWFELTNLPAMAFDHEQIIADARNLLRL